MVVFTYIILLVLSIAIFFIFGRKIRLLSYKISFIVLLVLLFIVGYLFIKVIYKSSDRSLTISELRLDNKYDNSPSKNNNLDSYKSKSVIIVGSLAKLAPWSYKENDLVLGYNIDLIKEATKLMGKKISIVVYDNEKDLYSALENKQIDIIADFSLIEKDNCQFTYSTKIVNPPLVFIGNKNYFSKFIKSSNENIQLPFENFLNKSILVENISFFIYSLYNVLGKNVNLTVLSDSKDVLSRLEQNKLEVGFVEYFSFKYYKNTHPNSNLVSISSLIPIKEVEGLGFIVNSNDIVLNEQLNIALNLLKRKGYMSKLSIKYFKKDVTL